MPHPRAAATLATVAAGAAVGGLGRGEPADALLFALAASTAVVVAVLQQTLP